ncbi:cadherin-like domain-containing protein [Piscirickettsia salmonis]|uniref:cadherin-like domain-containing protein n=1 Tax=Piscirickettsia salmonis TaxID=1238 RepID=UPI00143DC6C3|nr:cadherin-like domain-containing protein [Piscirickettsia salmonis]QIX55325.1 cadherin-like domain-containing protein [Piscirickettsia salmonis]
MADEKNIQSQKDADNAVSDELIETAQRDSGENSIEEALEQVLADTTANSSEDSQFGSYQTGYRGEGLEEPEDTGGGPERSDTNLESAAQGGGGGNNVAPLEEINVSFQSGLDGVETEFDVGAGDGASLNTILGITPDINNNAAIQSGGAANRGAIAGEEEAVAETVPAEAVEAATSSTDDAEATESEIPLPDDDSDLSLSAEPAADDDTVTVNDDSAEPVINNNPRAIDDNLTLSEDLAFTFNAADILANDSDVDGDSLALTGISQSPEHGALIDNGDGSWTFTPTENYNGQDSFIYTVSDGQGGFATATVALTIDPVNDDPVVIDSLESGTEDVPLVFDVSDLISDIDSNNTFIDSFEQPENGILTLDGTTFTFTPHENWHGDTHFNYVVADGEGGTAAGSVDMHLTAVNDDPTAQGHTFELKKDGSIRFSEADLLAGATDVDGDNLSATAVTDPANGDLVNNGDGTWTFTPDDNWNGETQFDYTLVDGQGGEVTETVTLDVDPQAEKVNVEFILNDQQTIYPDYRDESTNYTVQSPGDFGVTESISGEQMATQGIGNSDQISVGYQDENAASIQLESGWNSIKNIFAVSDEAADVSISDFVRTDVQLGDGGDSTVNIEGAKRGDITSGDGSDTINISAETNGAGWDNTFNISSAEGEDFISLSGDQDITVFNVNAGSGDDVIQLGNGYANSTIHAGYGDDTVRGGTGEDAIFGGAGDDALRGGQGEDSLRGGAGNDDLRGGAGEDVLRGGQGEDSLRGGAGNDDLRGGAGEDVLRGGQGDDSLRGGAGDDSLRGGAGDDALRGGQGDDSLRGGAGNDDLRGGAGEDVLRGGQGEDSLRGGAGNDDLRGGAGEDVLRGGQGDDSLRGGAGDDSLRGGAGDDALRGGQGDDSLRGGAGNDDLRGGAGEDVLRGGQGEDSLRGGAGDDNLRGGAGEDVLRGGAGDDNLRGGAGNDDLHGGAGNDALDGGEGVDTVYAGQGDDAATFVVGQSEGIDQYYGGSGEDTLRIELSAEQLENNDIIADLHGLNDFIADHADESSRNGPVETFEHLGVQVGDFEKLDIVVDGQAMDINDIQVENQWTNDDFDQSQHSRPAHFQVGDPEHSPDGGEALHGHRDADSTKDFDHEWDTKAHHHRGLEGEEGAHDVLTGSDSNDAYTLDWGGREEIASIEEFNTGAGDDIVDLASYRYEYGDTVMNLGEGSDVGWGNIGEDQIFGGAGNDWLAGNSGNDLLKGGLGDDRLEGNAGDDEIHVGQGDDIAMGHTGNDLFVFNLDEGNLGQNWVSGGEGEDSLQLSGSGGQNWVLHVENGGDGEVIHGTTGEAGQYGAEGGLSFSGSITFEDGQSKVQFSDIEKIEWF